MALLLLVNYLLGLTSPVFAKEWTKIKSKSDNYFNIDDINSLNPLNTSNTLSPDFKRALEYGPNKELLRQRALKKITIKNGKIVNVYQENIDKNKLLKIGMDKVFTILNNNHLINFNKPLIPLPLPVTPLAPVKYVIIAPVVNSWLRGTKTVTTNLAPKLKTIVETTLLPNNTINIVKNLAKDLIKNKDLIKF